MIKALSPLRYSKRSMASVRMPSLGGSFTVSLAASGIALQAYSSYMLVKTGNLSTFFNRNVADSSY